MRLLSSAFAIHRGHIEPLLLVCPDAVISLITMTMVLRRHTRMPVLLIVILLLAVSLARGASNATGIDPVDNYCSRVYHQSTVKNRTLYIDGGLEVFVEKNNNGTAEGARVFGYSMFYW